MSASTIKGAEGVIINSTYFLELPKAPTKQTTYAERAGMIRYNSAWKAFEGVLEFSDGSVSYRRFAQLDDNGQLLTSQLPDTITSGMQWIGTYSPISDDIDPPVDATFAKLPAPSADNSGQYYIVRGIYDAAVTHFRTNNPTTATVTFTPTNPSGQGNWIEIKYYIDTDPLNTAKKIVVAAYARIITASIPTTGHEGLVSLATDPTLTDEFTSIVDKTTELALTDGDWVISGANKNVRLRQNRISISAGAVSFDRTFLTASNRQFNGTSGTVQTIIDSLLLQGLRRTGDTMYNDGTQGAGRLGVTYGTATAPAIAFNSNPFDPNTDPGVNPALWSDTSTGIFHPATGSIGFTASGVERLRISPTQLVLYPVTNSTVSAPNILFSATGNTNLGINTTGNIISFVSNGATNVSLAQGLSTFNGNVIVTGNETINGNMTVNGNTILGDAGTDTLTVNAASTFVGSTSFNNASNRFTLGAVLSSGATLSFEGTNTASMTKAATELRFNMGNFDDVSIYDGATLRTRFNRYGIQLPVLNPINDAVGVDGMIAYSTQRNTVVQKSNGKWTTVGSGGGVATTFAIADWVLNGAYYTYTVTNGNIQQVAVQELSGSNYIPVEVDSIVISSTNAVLSVPATPDLRFNGRVIVQYQ
ncbi:hypothetical protein GAP32_218 [Cronobacter phage vB_CsaM_GAP32]|uniref:Uncharacterized protein n=1 Tax=Cronobacter phage vB_CsaM_GAP32 TaxID=1141136 RepID=K4F6T5_9CAUD|nr:hypothetical protein GAP32_218 [Cronobacter phage vB_CsaM_GAP32]AFC21668.1 hypothetical protein GAP32_218 [Cronobacter phage vB_CsaM_GAP32]